MQESSQLLLRYRRAIAVAVHLALVAAAQAGAFGLRFDFSIPPQYLNVGLIWLGANLLIRVVVFAWFGMSSACGATPAAAARTLSRW